MDRTGSDRIVADNASVYYAHKTRRKMEELVSHAKNIDHSSYFLLLLLVPGLERQIDRVHSRTTRSSPSRGRWDADAVL